MRGWEHLTFRTELYGSNKVKKRQSEALKASRYSRNEETPRSQCMRRSHTFARIHQSTCSFFTEGRPYSNHFFTCKDKQDLSKSSEFLRLSYSSGLCSMLTRPQVPVIPARTHWSQTDVCERASKQIGINEEFNVPNVSNIKTSSVERLEGWQEKR